MYRILDQGLTVTEADRRCTTHGLNQVGVKGPDPLWRKYIEQFNNPFILLLFASAVISVAMKQGRDSPIIKHYPQIKNTCFVTCVNSALRSNSKELFSNWRIAT
jgi:magnesium-transporting ATPase (P-type)